MFFNNLNNNFNLFIHKYGVLFHTILFLYILYSANIHPNTFIYWAFLINLFVLIYFIYVQGVAFGIKQTALLMGQIEDEKERENNRNN